MTRGCRLLLLCGGAYFALCGQAFAAPINFSISARSLPEALRAFGLQSGKSIVFRVLVTGTRVSPGVVGLYEPDQALAKILAGSALTYVRSGDAYTIVAVDRPVSTPAKGDSPASTPLLVLPQPAHPLDTPPDVFVEPVLITGSRLANAGFQAPTPITVETAAELQRQAPATIAEALQELPAFRADQTPASNTRIIGTSGQIQPDLRGLGASRTLSLLNGRRMIGSNVVLSPDIATVPTGMIDHVDVVTGGASAAYGSDAVAGVVNFVTNEQFEGFKGAVQEGISNYDDDKELVASVTLGDSFWGGRGHFVVGGDLAKVYDAETDGLAGTIYGRPWGATEPNLMANGTVRAAGVPFESLVENSEDIYAPGGVVLSGPLKGMAFTAAGAPYQFQYGPSVIGVDMQGVTSNYGQNPQAIQQLYHPYERENTMATGRFDITPDVEAYGEFMASWNNNKGGNGDTFLSTGANSIVNVSDPLLPASLKAAMLAGNTANVVIGRVNSDITPWLSDTRWATLRGVGGFRGSFQGWKWDISYERGHTFQNFDLINGTDLPNLFAAEYVVADATGKAVCGPLASNPNFGAQANLMAYVQPGCVPFNVFGQRNNAAAIDYVTNQTLQRTVITQTGAQFSATGDLLALPAGPLSLAFGGEWRKDRLSYNSDPRSQCGCFQTLNSLPYSGQQSVKEGFAEIGAPLLKDMPFAHSLALNGAFRRTDYQLTGAVSTWKVGSDYEPTDWLRFRFTKSHDIRAPNLYELFAAQSKGAATSVVNPFTGVSGRIITITGGNPNLKPEIADTVTAGMVIQPAGGVLRGFHASLDYFSIQMRGVIASIAATDIISRCFTGLNKALCNNIVFDNSAFGIISVSSLPFNQASLQIQGYDLEIDYRAPLDRFNLPGVLNIRNLTTFTESYKSGDGTVVTQKAGYSYGGMLKYTGQVNFTYDLDKLGVLLQAHYFDNFHWDPTLCGPDQACYNPAASNSINRNLFPGQVLWNLGLQYNLVEGNGRRLQIYGNINNVFNRQPPPQGAIAGNINGQQLYDTVGRYFRAGVRFNY